MESGDIVCVFRGTPMPLMLRQEPSDSQSEEIFKLVGEAYVHGIMDGEIFRAEKGEEIVEGLFAAA
jgi:hypothetical protein